MPETTEKGTSQDFKKWVDITTLLGKLFFAVAAVSYILGLLAANIYFGQFGVSTISVIKANCFLTGAWMILFLLFSSIIVFSIRFFIKDKSFCKMALFLFIMIVLLLFVNYTLRSKLGVETTKEWLYVLLCSLATVFIIMLFVSNVVNRVREEKESLWDIGRDFLYVAAHIILFFVMLLTYTAIFTKYVYPSIPAYIGGGKPVKVHVFVDISSEINNSFKDCKLTNRGEGIWEGKLILVTDNEYFFAVEDANEALCIKRQDVKAIKYYSKFFMFGGGRSGGVGAGGSF
jgi:hypothetical protein